MNLRIKIKDKEYDVEVAENDHEVRISIQGKEFIFDLDKRKVKYANDPENKTECAQRNIPEGSQRSRGEGGAKEGLSCVVLPKGGKEVKAPLAGVISDIFVKEGDTITMGQKLVSLSAMKMENEIVAEADAKIKKILVNKDEKVKESETLIIFD
ncbi:MAG: biotin/lipoyl-containing protein [Candidatus Paceibacterota bacterium]